MTRSLLERKLAHGATLLKELREELAVVDEQLTCLGEVADDARLRALVSETPVASREHDEAQRHADAMARHRADLLARIQRLERSQDELLDRLLAGTA
ncbi:MAG: hypothetical protein M3N25_03900 [Actinomycetota bacterium]|nr:hypothetical protein [Actinomycetota bacterium]